MVIFMENKLFREKSLNRITSPDDLTEYLRVTTPGVWIILIAVILLLSGVCVWGIFGRIDTKIDAIVVSDATGVYCLVEETLVSKIETGDEIRVEGRTYSVEGIGREATELTMADSSYILHLLGKTDNCWVIPLNVSGTYVTEAGENGSTPLGEGIYEGVVVVESIHPMEFITN